MRNRRVISLLLIAILVLAGANLYFSRVGRITPRTTRLTLLDATMLSPDALTLVRGSETVGLAYDGSWKFVTPFAGGVDEAVVKRMLDSLASAAVLDSLSAGEQERVGVSRDNLGLGTPRLSINLVCGGRSVGIAFGQPVPVGDGMYVSIDGDRHVYIVTTNVLSAVDVPMDEFRPRHVVDCSPSDIMLVDIKRGAGSLMRFVRSDDGWMMSMPREARAGTERLKKLLAAVSSVQVREWVWPRGATNEAQMASSSLLSGYGLDPDSTLTISVRNTRGEDIRLSLGDPVDKNSVYALLPGSTAIVTIDSELKDLALGESSVFTDLRLFPIDRKLIESVSIVDGNVSCMLKLGGNGIWRMESPVEAPVDEGAVDVLVKRLLALGPSAVDTNGVMVAVSSNLPPAVVSRDAIFGAGGLEDLRSRSVLKIDATAIKRLVIADAGRSPASAVYDRDTGKWAMESLSAVETVTEDPDEGNARALDDVALNEMASAMNPLTAAGVAKLKPASARLGEYGLDQPVRTIAIDSIGENASRRTVLIGSATPDGGRYATVGAADAVFVLSAETAVTLMRSVVRQ